MKTVNPYTTQEFRSKVIEIKSDMPNCADPKCVTMIRTALLLWAVIGGFVWIVVEACIHI